MGIRNIELNRRSFLLKAVLLAILVLATYVASSAGVSSGIPVAQVEVAKAAGDYQVRMCGDAFHQGGNWDWAWSETLAWYDPIGSDCSTTLGNLRARAPGPAVLYGRDSFGGWFMNTPAQVNVRRLRADYYRSGYTNMYHYISKCDLWDNCSWSDTPEGWHSYDSGWGWWKHFGIVVHCVNPSGCIPAWTSELMAQNFEFDMEDGSVPSIDPLSGTLVSGGWKKGTDQVAFYASDTGSGVKQIAYKIDGGAPQGWWGITWCSYGPSGYYDRLSPCNFDHSFTWTIDTTSLTDGTHTVQGVVQEATNSIYYNPSVTFNVDNNAPGPVSNMTNNGGDGASWTNNDEFDLQWTVPSQGSGSGIAKVKYQIDDGPVQEKTSGDMSKLEDLSTGNVGDHVVSIFLEDAAGNVEPGNARSIHAQFDDQQPGAAEPDELNGYVSAGETVSWQEVIPGEVPVSDIAGYAISFDSNPIGNPGEEITHPGKSNLSTELPGSVPEGESYIHVRAISGSGVAGPVNSEAIKVDQTKPNVDVSGHTDSWRKGPVTIGFTATDSYSGVDPAWPLSGLMYSVDGGSTQVAPGTTKSIDFHETGMHSLKTHAQDVAGNASDEINLAVRVDSKPPTLGFVKAKNPDDPTEVRAKATDEHSGFKSGTLYWKVEGSPKWKAMATQYVPASEELVAHVDDDSIPEDKKVEYLATGEDNVGNVGSSELDTEGNKYTALTPIKFGSYFKDGSDSGIVFERPVSKAACKKAKAGYRKARGRRSRAIERQQNARAKRHRRSMRRYESRVNKYCGYGKKKKSGKKKASKASFELEVAKTAAKRKSKRKKNRCKTVSKEGVTVRVCSKKKSKKKKTKSSVGVYAKRLQVGYGKRVWVRGRLAEKSGRGVSGVKIKIGTASTAQSSGDRAYKIVGRVKTTKNGVFRYLLPKGGGRHVKAFYEGSSTRRRTESRAITLFVKSRVGLKLRPKKLPNGRRVRLSGRVYFQGDEMPKRGKIVELQFRNRSGKKARWQTFRSIRTSGKRGRFKTSHKFKFIAYKQRIKFRVKVPAEAGWSYSTSTSRSRSVVVYSRR